MLRFDSAEELINESESEFVRRAALPHGANVRVFSKPA